MEEITLYKICSMCGKTWYRPADLVSDQLLRLNGYQAAVPDSEKGLLLFTHETDGCNSTLAVPARDFRFMYDGPVYSECNFGQPTCESHCLEHSDLEACAAQCCMAWVRDLIQYIRRHELPLRAG
jgi:hypothetical protein